VRINRSVAAAAVAAVTAALALPLLALPASASGSTTPPWEPDPATNFGTAAAPVYGTLTFYNSAGQVVTSGSNLAHLFDYAEASGTDPYNGTKATLYFAAPVPGETPSSFFVGLASASTAFPNSSAPAPLNKTANPVVTLASTDADLTNFIASVPAQTAAGYADVFQIRLLTTGPGGVGSGPNGQYWDADVQVNPTAGTWTQVYPSSLVATTTTLAITPAGSAQQFSSVTLSATETAADSTHPAGAVQFFEGSTAIGSAVTVNSSGVATLSTTALLPSAPNGAQLNAEFTPSAAGYGPSASGPVSYTVNPVAKVPTISGPHEVGARETCSEGALDPGVKASFTWLASGKSVGTGSTLTVPSSAFKKALACKVSVSDGGGPASTATSKSVTVLGALKATRQPTLSGPRAAGKTERVKPGTWSQKRVTFTYQWLLNGKTIKGATRSSLRLSKADKGKDISCRVTAHLKGYANGVATTKRVKVS
jgi:Bacterial Ig-like domain (group 3)